jgi:hypothetical protein
MSMEAMGGMGSGDDNLEVQVAWPEHDADFPSHSVLPSAKGTLPVSTSSTATSGIAAGTSGASKSAKARGAKSTKGLRNVDKKKSSKLTAKASNKSQKATSRRGTEIASTNIGSQQETPETLSETARSVTGDVHNIPKNHRSSKNLTRSFKSCDFCVVIISIFQIY